MGLLALFILPSVIAAARGVQGLGWIIVINLLPTDVGWLAALIAALALPGRQPTRVAAPSGVPLPHNHHTGTCHRLRSKDQKVHRATLFCR